MSVNFLIWVKNQAYNFVVVDAIFVYSEGKLRKMAQKLDLSLARSDFS